MARGKGGGPKSPTGRESSSKNSLKHGMRAKKIIVLPDEDPEELERMRFQWHREWEPEGYMEERLVEILVYNDWMLARGERRLQEAEADAAGEENPAPCEWPKEKRENVERMAAYRAQAERSFYRSLNALNRLRREFVNDKRREFKLERELQKVQYENERLKREKGVEDDAPKACVKELTPAQKLFQGQLHAGKKNPKKKVRILEQWIQVQVKEGKTITTVYPSNEEVIEKGKTMWPPPELVYRRLDFRCGVPKEYDWAIGDMTGDRVRAKYFGGTGTQRMTTDQWLVCIEREKHDPAGHVGPTGVGNLPRPKERGGCDCPSCTHPENLKLLEEWEKSRAA